MKNYGFRDFTPQEWLAMGHGPRGFKRLTGTGVHAAGAGSHADVNEFIRLRAVGGAATFGAGSVAGSGDAPAATDTIPEGAALDCRLTSVQLSAGIVYAYYI